MKRRGGGLATPLKVRGVPALRVESDILIRAHFVSPPSYSNVFDSAVADSRVVAVYPYSFTSVISCSYPSPSVNDYHIKEVANVRNSADSAVQPSPEHVSFLSQLGHAGRDMKINKGHGVRCAC